jgi:hypothetical protein
MATIALRFPSTDHNGQVMRGGHCYLVFVENEVTVRDLLVEKVRAEYRKARAGGIATSTLRQIFHTTFVDQDNPLGEQLHCAQILSRFGYGDVVLMVDGKAATSLDQVVELNRRTGLSLVIPAKVTANG